MNGMQNPLVSIAWINYNSWHMKDIVLNSLRAILSFDYYPFEIILVDNGSTDGSFELIKSFLINLSNMKVRIKTIRLLKNYGFAQANNIAFKARDLNAKYFVLINNDLVPEPNSLKTLIGFLEKHGEFAGVQGTILTWNGEIDNAGFIRTSQYNYYPLISTAYTQPTYLSGAYSVYRIRSIIKAGGLFLPYFFIYGDDNELGIRLWRSGYRLAHLPIIAGRHFGSKTIKHLDKPLLAYWVRKSHFAVLTIYDELWLLHIILSIPLILFSSLYSKFRKLVIKGFIDGIRLGLRLRGLIKLTKSREPMVKVNMLNYYRHRLLMLHSSQLIYIDGYSTKLIYRIPIALEGI